ncbi:MAG: hypothetical protein HY291_04560 [Planctomycetes bacterium]|nr:hypothetical protein [Planctomycetota bacterium]
MSTLQRLPPQDGQPASWLLLVHAEERDDAAREALEELLPPESPMQAALAFDPGGAWRRMEFELCDACPIMKWRVKAPGVLHVSLRKVALKALTELWELTAQGAGDYSFEVLDLTEDPQKPALTYLTIRLEGAPA